MATLAAERRRNGNGSRFTAPASSVVRVGVYARISSADRTNSTFTSIDAQTAACRSYIDSRVSAGWTASQTFIDNGFSGGTANRPALTRLLDDVQAGKLDLVLVHRIDRLSRSLRDLLGLLHVMEQHGVAFASVNESFDSSTPIGKATLQLVGVFAELERATISARTKDKIQAARRLGRWTGGVEPLGYTVVAGKLIVEPVEAHVVRQLFAIYAQTGSLIETARIANENGWRTKITATRDGRSRGGVLWSKSSIHRTITSPLYCGKLIAGGEAVVGQHEALIGVEAWQAVQDRLQSNAVAGSSGERHPSEALLAGILKCSLCGSSMTPTHCKKGPRKYSFYACSKRVKGGKSACAAPYVSAPKIEAQFVAEIARHATDPKLVEAVVCAAGDQLAERKRSLSDEARSVRRAIKDGEREVERGAVDGGSTRIDERIGELRKRASALEHEREALDATRIEPEEVAAMLAGSFDQVWGAMTSRERRRVADLLVEKIVCGITEPEITLRSSGVASHV